MKDRTVFGDEHSFSTLCVQGGNNPDPHSGAGRTPLVMANSYLLPEDTSETRWSDVDNPAYTSDIVEIARVAFAEEAVNTPHMSGIMQCNWSHAG